MHLVDVSDLLKLPRAAEKFMAEVMSHNEGSSQAELLKKQPSSSSTPSNGNELEHGSDLSQSDCSLMPDYLQ
jgi:hypothetical protein